MKKRLLLIELLLLIACISFLAVRGIHNNETEKAEIAQRIAQVIGGVRDKLPDPGEAFETVDADEWELLLVNPWNEMPEGYADSLEIGETEDYPVDTRIQEALAEMLAACRDAGHRVQIISAFRPHETQVYLYNRTANKDDTAYPGTSEHECGLAVDIIDSNSAGWSDPLIDEQETMPGQIWLMENCQNYGFILRYPKDKEDITGIIYEPWHYRYVGKEHAARIMESGKCLEEYLNRIENDKEKIKDQ